MAEYRVPDDCPDASWFVERIAARTSHVVFAAPSEAADVTVNVAVDASGQRAVIDWQQLGSTAESRPVIGSSCSEVVDAMALIVAMAVDPSVTVVSEEPSEPAVTAPPVPGAGPAAPSAHSHRAASEPSPGSPSLGPHASRRPFWTSAGLGVVAAYGAGPEFAPGLLAWVLGDAGVEPPWDLAVILALEADSCGTVEVTQGSARFVRLVSRLGACPVRWKLAPKVGLRPCGVFEAGVLRARGVGVPERESGNALWVAPGFMLRVESAVSRRWAMTLDGVASAPLAHDRFLFAPATEVFRIPAVACGLGVGVAATFR